jgi:hypothetical protein
VLASLEFLATASSEMPLEMQLLLSPVQRRHDGRVKRWAVHRANAKAMLASSALLSQATDPASHALLQDP